MEESSTVVGTVEVSMVEPEIVVRIKALQAAGWGSRRIADDVGVSRNAVKRYLRGQAAGEQIRPSSRRLDDDGVALARQLFAGEAGGNAVVVHEELLKRGYDVSERTVQRVVVDVRIQEQASAVATMRFETEPGEQMQIDFGEKYVLINGVEVKVHLMAGVLGFSRRIFVKAFLVERAEEWREGIAAAFRHFGGVTRTVLVDNTRCLVIGRADSSIQFNVGFLELSKDFGFLPRACQPYRARTKGKIENGVGYVKKNGLAARSFPSFAALEEHLSSWMVRVDARIHGTTHEAPTTRFEREKPKLLPLPSSSVKPQTTHTFDRKVSNDAFVDVDTVRYSVPVEFVRRMVRAERSEDRVRIFHGGVVVADHQRNKEPRAIVQDQRHRDGLFKNAADALPPLSNPSPLARPLDAYADIVNEASKSSATSPSSPKRLDSEVRVHGEEAVGGAP